jgi:gamma-glutamylcyclotransferase (GGCT)/AIG2-like uncharacterized protein YtfP
MEKKKEKKEKLFVYGQLKDHEIVKKVTGEDIVKKKAILNNFKVKGTEKEGRTLTTSPTAHARGDIIQVTPGDLKKLDDWEERYSRKRVKVQGHRAWAYFKKNVGQTNEK